MTPGEFSSAVHYIERTTSGTWPHDVQPMYAARGSGTAPTYFGWEALHPATEQEWLDYSYNPPGLALAAYPLADDSSDVRSKPTYAELVAAATAAYLDQISPALVALVNRRCTDRIARVYHRHANDYRSKEWHVRLSGIDTTVQDAERVRLIAVCHAFEAKISAAATVAEYEAIDPESEAVWSGAPVPGDGD